MKPVWVVRSSNIRLTESSAFPARSANVAMERTPLNSERAIRASRGRVAEPKRKTKKQRDAHEEPNCNCIYPGVCDGGQRANYQGTTISTHARQGPHRSDGGQR